MRWQHVFRNGIAPHLSTAGLVALRAALAGNDARLIAGAVTIPPPLQVCQDWPVEAACAIGFAGWQGDGLGTVAQVEEHFARVCFHADQRLEEPAGVRGFLNWWDETPPEEARPLLLVEVEAVLACRRVVQATVA